MSERLIQVKVFLVCQKLLLDYFKYFPLICILHGEYFLKRLMYVEWHFVTETTKRHLDAILGQGLTELQISNLGHVGILSQVLLHHPIPKQGKDSLFGASTVTTISCVQFHVYLRFWSFELVIFLVPQVGTVPLSQKLRPV